MVVLKYWLEEGMVGDCFWNFLKVLCKGKMIRILNNMVKIWEVCKNIFEGIVSLWNG